MPKRRQGRIYWRNQGGTPRAYADFRDYRDVGGGLEALIPHDAKVATDDPAIAETLAADRLRELQGKRARKALLGTRAVSDLASYVAHHLVEKKRAGKVTDRWLASTQARLDVAIEYFEADGPRDLTEITPTAVQDWATHLLTVPSGRRGGATMSPGNVRHYLNALSNLYRRAQAEGYVPAGFNPVAAVLEKPAGDPDEADWLEVHEAALLLEAARTIKLKREDLAADCIYPLIATYLLTGGRVAEVAALEVADVSFERRTIRFRTTVRRRLKTKQSSRSVPLWPQLEEILREWINYRKPGKYLFPATRATRYGFVERPIGDFRKALDQVAVRAGFQRGEIRPKAFRHTYCAARLQTLDRGHPVSPFTVARELGHNGDALVKRIYGHLGEIRHRAAEVEYRIEHFIHDRRIKERLRAMRVA